MSYTHTLCLFCDFMGLGGGGGGGLGLPELAIAFSHLTISRHKCPMSG